MNLVSKRLFKVRWLKPICLIALVIMLWGVHGGRGFALIPCDPGIVCQPPPNSNIPPVSVSTTQMPDPNDFSQGKDVYLVVARCDITSCTGAYQLDALSSTVRIFIRETAMESSKGFTFYIHDGNAPCGSEDDISSTNNTNFSMETLNYQGDSYQDPWQVGSLLKIGPGVSDVITSGQAGCDSFPVNIQQAQHGTVGSGQYNGWYGFQFTATLTNGVGWNSFKLSSSNAYFSYYSDDNDTNADHFAVKASPGSGTGSFAFPFAPNCSAGLSGKYDLKWYDADAGQSNQLNQNPVKTTLYAYNYATGQKTSEDLNIYADASQNPVNQGGHTDWDSYQYGGGGNKEGGYFDVTLQTGWIYSWQWNNVNDANGVQFKLPFDSFNAYSGLALTGACWTATCTATANPSNPVINQGSTIKVTLNNTSSSGLNFPSSFELRQTAPVGTPQGVGGLQAGKNETLTYNISARGSPTTIEFDYTLYSDSGSNGYAIGNNPLCSTTIQWSPQRNVSIDCQNVSVYGIKTTNVTYTGSTSKKYGPYYTTTRPSNYGQPGYKNNDSSTYQWSSTTPPTKAPSPYDQDPPPTKVGVVYWYFSGKTYTSSSTQTVDEIPVQFIMTGNGVNQTVYKWVSVDGSGNNPPPFNTFTTFTDAWPHKSGYVVALSYGSSGTIPSGDYYTNSPNNAQPAYNDTNHSDGGNATLSTVCLQISNCSASISPGDVEPGQSTKYSFVYPVNNQTGDSFGPGSGRVYDFGVGVNPGANVLPPTTLEPTIDTSGSVTVQYSGWLDYTGLYANDVVPNDGTGQVLARCNNTSTPYTKPYFQVWNSDTSAGGGFASPSGSCATSTDPPYISPANGSAGGPDAGGIRAFARSSVAGSSTDFGAIAMGQIPIATANGSQFVGFFSASGQNTYFANSGVSGLGSTSMGGYLNSTSTAHCVPDYFTETRESANPTNWSGGDISGLSSGQYTLTGSTISGGSVGSNYDGKQLTIYVDGDVTITGNIDYPSLFDPTTQSDIPYFTLIVRGNIYLTNNVTRLDGLYIAQPKTDGSEGVFATCDYSSDAQAPQGSQGPCNSQLVIDGAMIAQHVELLRNHSTLDPPDYGNQDGIGNNPAEIINYVPSMIIGSPAFQGNYGNVENVFSLPPVF